MSAFSAIAAVADDDNDDDNEKFTKDFMLDEYDGSFLAGEDGARAGIMMPGTVLLGARYFQALAPGVALDRAEIDSLSVDVSTPAGNFEDCLRTKETTTLESGSVSTKKYCPGVGLVQDGDLRLVSRRG